MTYLLDETSIGKLVAEIFGEQRAWVKWTEEEIENPDWCEEDAIEYGDDYDQEEYIYIKGIDVYVHFPDLTIKNSRGHEHPIMDMFTRFRINSINPQGNYKCYVEFEGRRTTFSLKEMSSNYIHSHLPGGYDFQRFCTGNSHYNTLLMDIRMHPTEENWFALFLGLKNFVSWESLEGGPYRSIADIRNERDNINEYQLLEELKKILPHMPQEVWSYNNGLQLIENHPMIYEFFNQHSSIRRMSGCNEKEMQELVASYEREYKGYCFVWKQGQQRQQEFPFKVVHQFEQDTPQIEKAVVDEYIKILKRKAEEYTKNLSYEHAKDIWYSKTIAKAGTFQ